MSWTAVLPAQDWPPGLLLAAFLAATAVIGLGGSRLAGLADRLADRTGLGEPMMGALFLGISTSLPGITASVTAALDGRPALAVSNAAGGIAVQTAFLAIADFFHRRANLEHAAATVTNLIHAALLILMLALVAMAVASPVDLSLGPVDAATPLLLATYALGLWMAAGSVSRPMWRPHLTDRTVSDVPDPENRRRSLAGLWSGFAVSAAAVTGAGMVVARSAGLLADRTGLSESVMGGLFVAVSTSLPELVTTIAAVRRGAVNLAVSDIVGGNAFDVLFICVADLAYLRGSIYRAAGAGAGFLVGLAIVLNALLLLGMLRRQEHGPANIGFESILILAVYLAGFTILAAAG